MLDVLACNAIPIPTAISTPITSHSLHFSEVDADLILITWVFVVLYTYKQFVVFNGDLITFMIFE